MSATAVATPPSFTDPELTSAVMGAVNNALTMCDTSAHCVGVSSIPSGETGLITGLIGVHGKVSGFVTVNLSQRMAIKAVEGLLQDSYGELTPQVVDGAGEITNIIVGGIKSSLSRTPWAFSHITVPSVIIGKGYQIAYARGLQFVCATFEHDDLEAVMLEDRLMRVSISLLKL
jgi:chemotaxis protein CheX